MRRTGSQIEQDFYAIFKASALPGIISGDVYKHGLRPIDSTKEDAVISLISGIDGQIQVGRLVLNIYVPDIESGGRKYRNSARCRALETELDAIIQNINDSRYDVSLSDMLQTYPEPEIEQHFISAKINFRVSTF